MYLVLIVGELFTFFLYILTLIITTLVLNSSSNTSKIFSVIYQPFIFLNGLFSSMCSSERVQLKIDIFRFVKQTLPL